MCKNVTISVILKMLNQSAFALVLSCNYCYRVELSEMYLSTEHAHEWQIASHISCIPGSGDPESFGGGGDAVLHKPIVLWGGHIA
jgi:hypothetical protein